jgi:hypothetical protein
MTGGKKQGQVCFLITIRPVAEASLEAGRTEARSRDELTRAGPSTEASVVERVDGADFSLCSACPGMLICVHSSHHLGRQAGAHCLLNY